MKYNYVCEMIRLINDMGIFILFIGILFLDELMFGLDFFMVYSLVEILFKMV